MKKERHIVTYVEMDERLRPKPAAPVHTETVIGDLNAWLKAKDGSWRILRIERKPCRKK